MKIKSAILLVLGCSLFMNGTAQNNSPVITFEEREHNFGTFSEAAGVITHDFQFTNTGQTPLIIHEVRASCGCTVPEWPREPVLPGKKGKIRVIFDPKKQSGSFNKTIRVNSNADVEPVTLIIKGVVIPAEQLEDVYKFTIGIIRLETIYAAFGEILKGRSVKLPIKVFNASKEERAVISFRQIPAHLKVKLIPEEIDPEQQGVIELEYITSDIKDWDYVVDRLELLVNDHAFPNNHLHVTANIREDFSTLTPVDLESAPHAAFDIQTFDFGTVTSDTVVEYDFKLKNTGKSDLLIRKVSASCGCTAVQPATTQIRPGESTVIKARFNAAGREGNQKKAITVITNDPKRSKTILWINGIVAR